MEFRPHTRRRSAVMLGGLLVLLLVLSLFHIGIPNVITRSLLSIATPVLGARRDAVELAEQLKSRTQLREENRTLRESLERRALLESDYEIVKAENERLRRQLGLRGETSRILGGVLSRPPTTPYDTFVIDRGVRDGVREGSRVYLSDTIAIGVVDAVSSRSARIRLFSTAGVTTEVVVGEVDTGIATAALGRGGGNYRIELPRNSAVVIGDTVRMSGNHTAVLGTVESLEAGEGDVTTTILFRVPVSFSSLNYVFIEE